MKIVQLHTTQKLFNSLSIVKADQLIPKANRIGGTCKSNLMTWPSPYCTQMKSKLISHVDPAPSESGIKKKVTLHSLRHSYATNLMERREDPRYIQILLGTAAEKKNPGSDGDTIISVMR